MAASIIAGRAARGRGGNPSWSETATDSPMVLDQINDGTVNRRADRRGEEGDVLLVCCFAISRHRFESLL